MPRSTSAEALSPATSAQVRRRQAARRDALERQRKLNEERRRRDEAEVDLAAEFAVWNQECAVARDAVVTAEVAMGRVVDRMIGELRIRYPRAAQLLEMPEDELRRLRQLAAEPASLIKPVRGNPAGDTVSDEKSDGKNGTVNPGHPVKRGRTRSRRDTTTDATGTTPSADAAANVIQVSQSAAGATGENERRADASASARDDGEERDPHEVPRA